MREKEQSVCFPGINLYRGRVYTRKSYTVDNSTISLSQKTKGSLLALAWRELTTRREERLRLLRLSRGAKEEDESQIALLRTISLSQKTKESLLALPVLLYIHNDSYQIHITICK